MVGYQYGARGLISAITANGQTLAGYEHDANGRRALLARANGTQTAYGYDAASRLTSLRHVGPNGVFAGADYVWDEVNRPTERVSYLAGLDPKRDLYEHDAIDQLIRVRYGLSGGVPERDVQYNYDLLGNRVSVVEDGVSTAYTVNALNQYVTVGGEPLTYDANGNLTSGLGLSLQYDAQNRLISVATASNVVMLAYDGRNRCVRRTVVTEGGGSVVYLVWGHAQSEQWGLVEERGPSGELVGRYVHGAGIDELLAGMSAGGGVVYYHQDHLNSTLAVTDESGTLLEQYRYDVFGKPFFLAPDGTPRSESARGVRFLFTGREYLALVVLYDYRHRAHSPTLGRFLQVDPVASQARGETNPYLYCNNTPVWGFDPQGLRIVFRRHPTVSWWHYLRLRIAFLRAIHRRTPCGELTIGARYLRELADPANPYHVEVWVGRGQSFADEPEEGRAFINVCFLASHMEVVLVHEAAHAWAYSRDVYSPPKEFSVEPGAWDKAAERHATAVENQHRWALGLPQRSVYGK